MKAYVIYNGLEEFLDDSERPSAQRDVIHLDAMPERGHLIQWTGSPHMHTSVLSTDKEGEQRMIGRVDEIIHVANKNTRPGDFLGKRDESAGATGYAIILKDVYFRLKNDNREKAEQLAKNLRKDDE